MRPKRLNGLDSIRFVCAFWVMAFHTIWVFGHAVTPDGAVISVFSPMRVVVGNLFSGPAAVIVFFVISGIVVHYPNVGRELNLYSHFTRRFIRVGGPILALAIGLHVLTNGVTLLDLPVWSLWCELVYYALYPLVLLVEKRFGLTPIVAGALAAALVVAVLPGSSDPAFVGRGNWVTWILGLPAWLIGALVAEHVNSAWAVRLGTVRRPLLWSVRLGIIASGSATLWLRFHTPLSEQVTLVLLSLPLAVWLLMEIQTANHHPPMVWLEQQGRWSYSLYLVHPLASFMLMALLPMRTLMIAPVLTWIICLLLGFALARLFYTLVENPFHNLARLTSNMTVIHAKRSPLLREP